MSSEGCVFCVDAPEADFDWCRVCGRGAEKSEGEKHIDRMRALLASVNARLHGTSRDNLG